MTVYGLYGFTHASGKVLTVMSAAGVQATRAAIDPGGAARVEARPGQLTQYIERHAGGLRQLVAENGIVVLDKPAWDAQKRALGEAIYR